MADTDTEPLPNGTGGGLSEEDERLAQRPADIDADVRAMERGKRVEALMSSKLFREELERVLDQQLHEGGDAPLLQRIREMVGGRLHSGSFRGPSCVLPINDIRGIEGVGYEKGEKILRCKLAAAYRLVDLFGWTQTGISGQISARLNTAVEQVLTTPRGVLPHEVTASSLVKVDMQGAVVDQGTTNFPVNVEGFSVHAMVHAARPDLRCVLHVRAPAALAVSSMKDGLLPLSTEAALLGDVAYHQVPYGTLDNEEQEKLVRALGPYAKVLILSNDGALCCGSTLEEAFYQARNLTAACDVQLRLASIPLEKLSLMDDDTRRQIYESSRKPPADQQKWRAGGEEFEALMRMLDNAGFRTGYVYRHPLIKNDVPRPKNDVEVPPAVSSLGYLLEEEELYRQGLWKKGHGKTGERTRWLNSPNVYQKVEVLETGTNDPKKITKWVDANNEEWVQDGSPQHSSTPVKIDTLQFVPKNTNPKEFKKLQQQIKDNRRADMISAGPQSHILEGVTWDEAAKLTEDAVNTATGDHVVLMGAASKGIIQRGYQHNATVYSAPYARNPFDRVTDSEIADYRRIVERKQRGDYDTDVSESEAFSGAQFTSPLSETEEESRDEHRVLRIETKQVPVRSQPEIVLSDDFINAERAHSDRTKDPNLLPDEEVFYSPISPSPMVPVLKPAVRAQNTVVKGSLTSQELNSNAQVLTEALTSNHRSKHEYSRTASFETAVKKFSSPEDSSHASFSKSASRINSSPDIGTKMFNPSNNCTRFDKNFANYDNANKKFGSNDNIHFANLDKSNKKFDSLDKANFNANVMQKCDSNENSDTNTTVKFGNVTNITNSSNFARVRERFNSPDLNDNKLESKSCGNVRSPVYGNINKFISNSCGNANSDIHPKCKVSLHARLSAEGNSDAKNVEKPIKVFNKGSQTDIEKEASYDTKTLKNFSNLSSLAKLASEIRNDAYNLNSKITIETLNSKLASEANSESSHHSKYSCQHTKDEELYSYALDLYNPGHNSPRSSLYSVPSLDWDRRCQEYNYRSRSLPRRTKTKEQRLYRTQSHSGFVNAHIKDPEPTHFHLPRCNSCGATNVSYNWELIKEDLLSLKSTGRKFTIPTSVYMSVDDIHQKCLDEASKVKVTSNVVPVYKVVKLEEEFVESQEFNEDNYFGDIGGDIGTSFSSDNQTVIEKIVRSNEVDVSDKQKSPVTEFGIDMKTCDDHVNASGKDWVFEDTNKNETLHRAEPVTIIDDNEIVAEKDNTISTEGEYHSFTDELDFDSAYISPVKELVEKDIRDYSVPIGFYCDDYKKDQSPTKMSQSPKRPVTPKSPKVYGIELEPILEESKSSYGDESGNLSNSEVKRNSGQSSIEKFKSDVKTVMKVDMSGISQHIEETHVENESIDKNISNVTSTEEVNDIKYHKQISVQILLSNLQYEPPTSSDILPRLDSQSANGATSDDVQKIGNYNVTINDTDDFEVIYEKGNEFDSTNVFENKVVNDVVQDIFNTAVTAVELRIELTASTTQKVTQELLNTELNKDSYLIAEEDDFTTNDIESVATNAVQTAIDVYFEGEEGQDTDIMDCVYDNIFQILSEEAISGEVSEKSEMRSTENDSNSLDVEISIRSPECVSVDQSVEKRAEDTIINVLAKDEESNAVKNDPVCEILAAAAAEKDHIGDTINEVEDDQFVPSTAIENLTENSMICIERISFDSAASQTLNVRSFDSTIEFEKYEVVCEVLSSILNRIEHETSEGLKSCEMFNDLARGRHVMTNFELDSKVIHIHRNDEPTKNLELQVKNDLLNTEEMIYQDDITNAEPFQTEGLSVNQLDCTKFDVMESVLSFSSQNIPDRKENMLQMDIDNNLTQSIIIELPYELQDDVEHTKTDPIDVEVEPIQPDIEFSIAKIIQDIEHSTKNTETDSTETSNIEDPAIKVGEALMYYIFDRVFCLLGEKRKSRNHGKVKKVVTVADSEDILMTAKSIWPAEDLKFVVSLNTDKNDDQILKKDIVEIVCTLDTNKEIELFTEVNVVDGTVDTTTPIVDTPFEMEVVKPFDDIFPLKDDELMVGKENYLDDVKQLLLPSENLPEIEIDSGCNNSCIEVDAQQRSNITEHFDAEIVIDVSDDSPATAFEGNITLTPPCDASTESECIVEALRKDLQDSNKSQIVDCYECFSDNDIPNLVETPETENLTRVTYARDMQENCNSYNKTNAAEEVDIDANEIEITTHDTCKEKIEENINTVSSVIPIASFATEENKLEHTMQDTGEIEENGNSVIQIESIATDENEIVNTIQDNGKIEIKENSASNNTGQDVNDVSTTNIVALQLDESDQYEHEDDNSNLDFRSTSFPSGAKHNDENIDYSLQYEDFNTTFYVHSYENESNETEDVTTVEHDINRNSTDIMNETKDSEESVNNNTYTLSDYNESFDIASQIINNVMEKSIDDSEYSKTENSVENYLNETFVLEKSSDMSMNTAFLLDSTNIERSSSPQKDTSLFESCSESPIRNSESFLDNSAMLYEKEDTLLGSPFVKKSAVISMSQTVNTGGVKYWVSFDESLHESVEKTTYRATRKSHNDMPSFFSVDFTKDQNKCEDTKNRSWSVYDKETKRRNSVLLEDQSLSQSSDTKQTEESFATAYVSTDYHTCESDLTNSKTESKTQRKLLYNSKRTDNPTNSLRRAHNSWPPYENTLYYKIISKFRMSESFDAKDFENIKIDDTVSN